MKDLVSFLCKKITKGKTEKMREKIEMSVFSALYYSNVDISIIESFVKDCEDDKIWISDDFFNSSLSNKFNIFDFLEKKEYTEIIKKLMVITPNIGSPNASTGEYEIMLLLTSQKTTKPTKGDIKHTKYGLKNLKGDNPRIFTKIRGKDLNVKMISLLEKYEIPIWKHKGIKYGQLLSEIPFTYYNKQFIDKNLNDEQIYNILYLWFISLFPTHTIDINFISELIHNSLEGNQVIWHKWIKNNMIFIFKYCEDKYENFMVLDDNGNVFHLTNEYENFKELVDCGVIKYSNNYFRLNQDFYCGVYLKINQ